MKELTEGSLKNKLKNTITKCTNSNKFTKIMDDVVKQSKTKPEFWVEIVKKKHKPLLDITFAYLLQQKNMKKSLSYFYSSKFTKELNKKNKKLVKESFIMNAISVATRDIIKKLKQQK